MYQKILSQNNNIKNSVTVITKIVRLENIQKECMSFKVDGSVL